MKQSCDVRLCMAHSFSDLRRLLCLIRGGERGQEAGKVKSKDTEAPSGKKGKLMPQGSLGGYSVHNILNRKFYGNRKRLLRAIIAFPTKQIAGVGLEQ